jgi:hypothetical protein
MLNLKQSQIMQLQLRQPQLRLMHLQRSLKIKKKNGERNIQMNALSSRKNGNKLLIK